ncbi:unnamed protein product [Sphagnum balticum]
MCSRTRTARSYSYAGALPRDLNPKQSTILAICKQPLDACSAVLRSEEDDVEGVGGALELCIGDVLEEVEVGEGFGQDKIFELDFIASALYLLLGTLARQEKKPSVSRKNRPSFLYTSKESSGFLNPPSIRKVFSSTSSSSAILSICNLDLALRLLSAKWLK